MMLAPPGTTDDWRGISGAARAIQDDARRMFMGGKTIEQLEARLAQAEEIVAQAAELLDVLSDEPLVVVGRDRHVRATERLACSIEDWTGGKKP